MLVGFGPLFRVPSQRLRLVAGTVFPDRRVIFELIRSSIAKVVSDRVADPLINFCRRFGGRIRPHVAIGTPTNVANTRPSEADVMRAPGGYIRLARRPDPLDIRGAILHQVPQPPQLSVGLGDLAVKKRQEQRRRCRPSYKRRTLGRWSAEACSH